GCVLEQTFVVPEKPGELFIRLIDYANACGDDGLLVAEGYNGASPYSYTWSNGVTTASNPLAHPGYNIVTVIDNDGCAAEATFFVMASDSEPPVVTGLVIYECGATLPADNGAIYLTVTSGAEPYNFLWSNSATDDYIDELPAGVYTVTVTDDN